MLIGLRHTDLPLSGCVGGGRRPCGWHADGSTKMDSSRGVPLTEVRYRHRRPDAAVDASGRWDLTPPEFVTGDLNRPDRSAALRLSCNRRLTRQRSRSL